MVNFFKKYHKWLGVVIALIIILFSISGIVLNHRKLLSSIDILRKGLAIEYQIENWNNAAVKSTEKIASDSIIIYGNVGIWLTDSSFSKYKDFNQGLPEGIDNRKICKVFHASNGEIYAGSFFGLYQFDLRSKKWKKVHLPVKEERIVDLMERGDTLYILTRSHLILSSNLKDFVIKELPKPEGYDNKISLFKTLWVIHSGEIYGSFGKIFVDVMGLIFIFLTITGLSLFINGIRIRKRFKKKISFKKIKSTNFWNLRWHNKIGWITLVFLFITTLTGMFLRPPLLIAIANAKVGKIPGTELSVSNPWFDKLRRILYDEEQGRFMVATVDGFYYSDDNFNSDLKAFETQPPASVMGVTVFRKQRKGTYLVGSFEGLFEWSPAKGEVFDYIKKEPYAIKKVAGPPIGDYLITGFSQDFKGEEIAFDYNLGAININRGRTFSKMPTQIKEAYRMSLWNLALEVHTGRIFQSVIGIFYILIVPLTGLIILFILISGFIVWWKLHKES